MVKFSLEDDSSHALPVADAGLDDTIRFGFSTVIGGAPTAALGTPGYTYSWTPPAGGLNDPTLANPTATPVVTTTYIVTVADTNGCLAVDSIIISWSDLTVEAGFTDTFCLDSGSAVIGGTPTANGGTGIYTYSWVPQNGTLSDSSDPNPIAIPSVTTNYVITLTDTRGCVVTDSVIVAIYPQPLVNAGFDVWICPSDTAYLNATGSISDRKSVV